MTYTGTHEQANKNAESLDLDGLRNTQQFLMPARTTGSRISSYEIYPSFQSEGAIYSGYQSLAEHMLNTGGNFILDGYVGVQWSIVKDSFEQLFKAKQIDVSWVSFEDYLKNEEDINQLISPFLGGDDPLFGKIFTGQLADFFDQEKLAGLKPDTGRQTIVYGCGAALANWASPVIYFDLPKNEIQIRSRAGAVKNLGANSAQDPGLQYKRFYFIDWVISNAHKQALLPKLEIIVDEQRPDDVTWMHGTDLRRTLNQISRNVFRARPWFEPGVWGGQWIKNNIKGLNKDVVNYAWSFELIAPENGIILENNGLRLEISIDMLLYNDNQAVLGKAAKRFGYKYPIRFDFLDTMDGDNLSLQCHPSVSYTRENFGEDFTQDETYYILEAKEDAEVYLGFQPDIDKEQFKSVLKDSFADNSPIEVEKYVQVFPAKKHDLFLIPNGTVHCSGKNNLVLEISATPYIFTFKMYDWVRSDLNGNPRTLNIDRAFENLNFERKGNVVSETLISKQGMTEQGADWQKVHLSTHPEHFYQIERLEFDTLISDVTNNQCLVLSLVEGDSIVVQTGQHKRVIHYAETFIIPASANTFTMHNTGSGRAKVIKAFVKDECC
jgi:mannose-6-phosphate isomerase class I